MTPESTRIVMRCPKCEMNFAIDTSQTKENRCECPRCHERIEFLTPRAWQQPTTDPPATE